MGPVLFVQSIPKLEVVFPTKLGQSPLIAVPFVLLMGWKNSPPHFCTATENITDLTNQQIHAGVDPPTHSLEDKAETVVPMNPMQP